MNWDELLDPILFSYRVTKQASTKYSPFYMMFGREPRLPIDVELMSQQSSSDTLSQPTEEEVTAIVDQQLKVHKTLAHKASANIHEAQTKQKEYYDRKHQPEELAVGTKVLRENTAQKQRKGGKLSDKWLGPYIVHKQMGKGVYQLKTVSGTVLKQKCNVSRLKVYHGIDRHENTSAECENSSSIQDGPHAASENSSSTQDGPHAASENSSSTQDGPHAASENSNSTQDGPHAASENSNSTQDGPHAASENSNCTQDGPHAASENSNSTQDGAIQSGLPCSSTSICRDAHYYDVSY